MTFLQQRETINVKTEDCQLPPSSIQNDGNVSLSRPTLHERTTKIIVEGYHNAPTVSLTSLNYYGYSQMDVEDMVFIDAGGNTENSLNYVDQSQWCSLPWTFETKRSVNYGSSLEWLCSNKRAHTKGRVYKLFDTRTADITAFKLDATRTSQWRNSNCHPRTTPCQWR